MPPRQTYGMYTILALERLSVTEAIACTYEYMSGLVEVEPAGSLVCQKMTEPAALLAAVADLEGQEGRLG